MWYEHPFVIGILLAFTLIGLPITLLLVTKSLRSGERAPGTGATDTATTDGDATDTTDGDATDTTAGDTSPAVTAIRKPLKWRIVTTLAIVIFTGWFWVTVSLWMGSFLTWALLIFLVAVTLLSPWRWQKLGLIILTIIACLAAIWWLWDNYETVTDWWARLTSLEWSSAEKAVVDGYSWYSSLPWFVYATLFCVFLFLLAGSLTNFREVLAGLGGFAGMVLVIGITMLIVIPWINSFNW